MGIPGIGGMSGGSAMVVEVEGGWGGMVECVRGMRGRELVEEEVNDGSLMAAIEDEGSVEPTEIPPPMNDNSRSGCNACDMNFVMNVTK